MMTPLAAGSSLPDHSPEAAIVDFLHALNRPQRLLVAVSGGSDSLGLLLILKSALEIGSFPHRHSLVAATVDHGLRPAAAAEAQQVAALCHRLAIPHRVMLWDGQKPKTGLLAAGRQARYRLLTVAAQSFGANAIVTGHTLDDQIETVTMRAARSNDEALGLAGMADATLYAGRIWILRPFLRTQRSAIRRHLDAMHQAWTDDPSNEDTRFERVRIRRTEPDVDPAVIEAAANRRRTLSGAAARWLTECARAAPGQLVTINLSCSQPCAPPVRGHALATLIAIIGGKSHRPAAESIARLAAALDSGADFRLTLSGTLVLRHRNDLFLVRERRGLLPLSLARDTIGVWDGRYAIANKGAAEIIIRPGPTSEIATNLPGAIRSALAGNAPQVIAAEDLSEIAPGSATIAPRLSLFAEFMPGFDQALADAIAPLVGAQLTVPAPI